MIFIWTTYGIIKDVKSFKYLWLHEGLSNPTIKKRKMITLNGRNITNQKHKYSLSKGKVIDENQLELKEPNLAKLI